MTNETQEAVEVAPATPSDDGAQTTTTQEPQELDGIGKILGVAEEEDPTPSDEPGAPEEPETDGNGDPAKAKLPKEAQAAFDKRIGKEVAKRKELENQLRDALARIEVMEQTSRKPTESSNALKRDPLQMSGKELAEYEQEMRDLRRWCNRYRVSGYEDDKGNAFTADQIEERLAQVEDALEVNIPNAKKHLEKLTVAEEKAKKAFPAMFKPESAEYRSAQALLKLVPEFRRVPEYQMLIGYMFAGQKSLRQPVKPGQAAPPVPIPGSKPGSTRTGKPMPKPGEAVKEYLEGGATIDSLAKAIQRL